MQVITRFAPSPTGYLHLGGARTALFNWLFAHNHGGKFLLRIEDTDKIRSTPEAVAAILQGMHWLGLEWQDAEIYQSSRIARHQEIAHHLLASDKAYKCFTTPEQLATMREEAKAQGRPPIYNRQWRDVPPEQHPQNTPFVIRLKMPLTGKTEINDAVQGLVTIDNSQLDDMVLLRADGTPTYMLSVVVDDHDMNISHIIRGDDHLNNAFRQYHLFQAMAWPVPIFAHIPLIHGQDGAKMSKRHGAIALQEYEEMGILPEAMRNYLLRLGWGHGDTDIISTAEAVKIFQLQDIGKAPARFDMEKLLHLNAHYLKTLPLETTFSYLAPILKEKYPAASEQQYQWLQQGLPSILERSKTTHEATTWARIYLSTAPFALSEKAATALTLDNFSLLEKICTTLEKAAPWTEENLHLLFNTLCTETGLKLGKIAMPLRIALTGDTAAPSNFEIMRILGKTETLHRIKTLLLQK